MDHPKQAPPVPTVLTVAGVDLRVASINSPAGSYESWYEPFVSSSPTASSASPTIEIGVHRDRVSPSDAPLVFESGGAWNMQMEPDGYRLNFHREDGSEYHTVACSNADTTEVRVYIDQDRVEPPLFTEAPSREAGLSPIRYPLDQLLLMNHLAHLRGVIVHGAGVLVGEKAVVCPGPSGAGKSTLARLFMDAGLGGSLLSDDRVILRRLWPEIDAAQAKARGKRAEQQQVSAWGTPWPGDAGAARNAAGALDALLFLVKAEANELRPLSPRIAARRLMPVVTCPWYDPDRLPGVLETCSYLVENIPCYELLFRADAEVVRFLADRPWSRKGGSS